MSKDNSTLLISQLLDKTDFVDSSLCDGFPSIQHKPITRGQNFTLVQIEKIVDDILECF